MTIELQSVTFRSPTPREQAEFWAAVLNRPLQNVSGDILLPGEQLRGHGVGLFWSRALGWPLVWEEGEETAIQSPAGGTKIAWSGDRFDPDLDRDRQYFVLSAPSDQLDDDVRRLLDLGASAPTPGESGETILRDPDNNRFVVRPN